MSSRKRFCSRVGFLPFPPPLRDARSCFPTNCARAVSWAGVVASTLYECAGLGGMFGSWAAGLEGGVVEVSGL